ncbi:MAG: VWA domain-containing protein, partial [Candidatus Cloacimonadia bacterium]
QIIPSSVPGVIAADLSTWNEVLYGDEYYDFDGDVTSENSRYNKGVVLSNGNFEGGTTYYHFTFPRTLGIVKQVELVIRYTDNGWVSDGPKLKIKDHYFSNDWDASGDLGKGDNLVKQWTPEYSSRYIDAEGDIYVAVEASAKDATDVNWLQIIVTYDPELTWLPEGLSFTNTQALVEFGEGAGNSDFRLGFLSDISYRKYFEQNLYHGEWGKGLFGSGEVKANLNIDCVLDSWIKFGDTTLKAGWDAPSSIDTLQDIAAFFSPMGGMSYAPPSYFLFETDIEACMTLSFPIHFEAKAEMSHIYSKEIFHTYGAPILAGPVYIQPEFWIEIGVRVYFSGRAEIDFTPSFKATLKQKIFAELDTSLNNPSADFDISKTIINFEPTFDYSFLADATFEIEPYAHIGLSGLVYGLVGPGVTFGPALSLKDRYDVISNQHQAGLYPAVTGSMGSKVLFDGMPIREFFDVHTFNPLWTINGGYPGEQNPPFVDFDYSPLHPIEDETIQFVADCKDDDGIQSYQWDFGDGTIETGKMVSHSFADPGLYTVTLQAKDNAGLSASKSLEIPIDHGIQTYEEFTLISPTAINPAFVGKTSNPSPFNAVLNTGNPLVEYTQNAFIVAVNGRQANFQIISHDTQGNYYLRIMPPIQESEGSYDLEVGIPQIGEVDIQSQAVVYSSGNSVNVVEVLDRSGSMAGEKMIEAKNAANLFIDRMSVDDFIGICSYSSSSSVNFPLTHIESDTTKQNAKNAVNAIYATGGTSIGAGLQAAYTEFMSRGSAYNPWGIVLLTDGQHNTAPDPEAILPNIKAANIKIYSVGLGSDADTTLLSYLADETGGEYYYSPTSEELTVIYNSISGVVKSESVVKTFQGNVQKGSTDARTVSLDPSIDIVTFTITWASGTVNINLTRPNGQLVDSLDSDVISYARGTLHEIWTLENPQSGTWIIEVTTPLSDPPYSISISGETNFTYSLHTNKDIYSKNEPIKIVTILSDNGIPVTGSRVNATVQRPGGSFETLTLYDDGYHDDGDASDGVYSNFYTHTSLSGTYFILASASGNFDSFNYSREATKTFMVTDSEKTGNITINESFWDIGELWTGETAYRPFELNSTMGENTVISLATSDFSSGNHVIDASYIHFLPDRLVVPGNSSTNFYALVTVPLDAAAGNYSGAILIQGTNTSLQLPVTIQILRDTTAPLTESVLDGVFGNNDWFVSNVTVELLAVDDLTGVNITKYKMDGDAWHTYNSPIVLASEGIHNVTFYSEDNVGNAESARKIQIKIDKSKPTITIDRPANTNLYVFDREILPLYLQIRIIGKITVTTTPVDNISGISMVKFFFDGQSRFNSSEDPYEWLCDERAILFHKHTISVRVVDNAGHETITEGLKIWIFNI